VLPFAYATAGRQSLSGNRARVASTSTTTSKCSQLLQRAVSTRARAGRDAGHREHRRHLRARAAGRVPPAAHGARPVFDAARPHAARAPGARGMDAVMADCLGRAERARDRALVAGLLERRPHPEQDHRACNSIGDSGEAAPVILFDECSPTIFSRSQSRKSLGNGAANPAISRGLHATDGGRRVRKTRTFDPPLNVRRPESADHWCVTPVMTIRGLGEIWRGERPAFWGGPSRPRRATAEPNALWHHQSGVVRRGKQIGLVPQRAA
jgi:hypothetical protein